MKVFYIGDFSVGYSTEVYVAHGLEQNGVEVERFQESLVSTAASLLEKIEDFGPDFVLFAKPRYKDVTRSLIKALKQKGILTVSWNFDLYFNLPPTISQRYVTDPHFTCDIVFMTDGGDHQEILDAGINKVTLRQGIHEPDAVIGEPQAKRHDVIFVGSASYVERNDMLEFLQDTYKDNFHHYGAGGGTRETRGLALNNVLASAKIVVGDSVVSPKYWSNRMYEMIGRGGFLLHPKVDTLDKEFPYYECMVPFDYGNYQQLKFIIDHYLENEDKRRKIQATGFKHCKENHTYTKRCEELLSIVKNGTQNKKSRRV